jgi:hypothetical protein
VADGDPPAWGLAVRAGEAERVDDVVGGLGPLGVGEGAFGCPDGEGAVPDVAVRDFCLPAGVRVLDLPAQFTGLLADVALGFWLALPQGAGGCGALDRFGCGGDASVEASRRSSACGRSG